MKGLNDKSNLLVYYISLVKPTPIPWFVRFSFVHFQFVRIFKTCENCIINFIDAFFSLWGLFLGQKNTPSKDLNTTKNIRVKGYVDRASLQVPSSAQALYKAISHDDDMKSKCQISHIS